MHLRGRIPQTLEILFKIKANNQWKPAFFENFSGFMRFFISQANFNKSESSIDS